MNRDQYLSKIFENFLDLLTIYQNFKNYHDKNLLWAKIESLGMELNEESPRLFSIALRTHLEEQKILKEFQDGISQ